MEIPKEYESLKYLYTFLGTEQCCRAICEIWNKVNDEFVYVHKCIPEENTIMLRGISSDPQRIVDICKWLTSPGILVLFQEEIIETSYKIYSGNICPYNE